MAYAYESRHISPAPAVHANLLDRAASAAAGAFRRLATWSDQRAEEEITIALLARAGGRLTDSLEREAQLRWTRSSFGVRNG